jgi:hypothetical protein
MEKNSPQYTALPETCGRHFNWRGFFSLLLFISFVLLLFTGAILYVTPKGRVAHWTGWAVLGLAKEQWSAIHMTSALIVLIAAAFHLYYNWGIFWTYIRGKARSTLSLKREMALAILLCVLTVAGTIHDVPPFGMIVQWNDDIKAYWDTHSAMAPNPHAEEFSTERLAEEIGMPLEQVTERLEKAGVAGGDTSAKVKDLAAEHGMTPSELFSIIQPESRGVRGSAHGVGRGGGGQGKGRDNAGYGATGNAGRGQDTVSGNGQGYGRMTVQQCCESAHVPVGEGLARLKKTGIEASSHESLKAIAQRSGKRPTEVMQIVHGR